MSGRKQFNYRRLHSLLGVIPIGVFLIQHLVVNHYAVYGRESFNQAAHVLESLPFKLVLETFVIYLPILFHAILGVYIVFVAKNNAKRYGFFRNWMFYVQRITGIITLIFIVWHVWETRVQIGMGNAEANFSLMENILASPAMFWFYIIGVISTTFHFSNGLWSFLVSWGITQSPRSQQIATYATLIIFLALSYVGVSALIAFT
ncbi:succinate dehydrogenase cytochrome b558 subunit [Virgibacillus sp. DJP39]|uniref:succinate dehydrogenase cytochrome b558 subunit n=1 Tax=Virgibacillus sp. DJP39 TaxID=3409790 RepID=UPI003BB7C388